MSISNSRKAAAYVRVSSRKQVPPGSLPAQIASCRATADELGLDLPAEAIFVEVASTKLGPRPALDEALQYCAATGVSVLFLREASRLSRSSPEFEKLREFSENLGLNLHLSGSKEPLGWTEASAMVAAAEDENQVKSRTTRKGMLKAARNGLWPFKVPIGYRRLHGEVGSLIVPDPKLASPIEEAFRLVADGEPIHLVLARVSDLGLRKGSGATLSMRDFRRLLKNPVYAGVVAVPQDNLCVVGRFPPVVTGVVFERVQRRLGKGPTPRKDPKPPTAGSEFPLRRFVQCTECGGWLTGSASRGGNGRLYGYYRCWRNGCVTIAKVDLHNLISAEISRLCLNRQLWQQLKKALIECREQYNTPLHTMQPKLACHNRVGENEHKRCGSLVVPNTLAHADDDSSKSVGEVFERALLLAFADEILAKPDCIWEGPNLDMAFRFLRIVFPAGLEFGPGGLKVPRISKLFELNAA